MLHLSQDIAADEKRLPVAADLSEFLVRGSEAPDSIQVSQGSAAANTPNPTAFHCSQEVGSNLGLLALTLPREKLVRLF